MFQMARVFNSRNREQSLKQSLQTSGRSRRYQSQIAAGLASRPLR